MLRLAITFLLAGALSAAPVIREISPRGARRGETFQLLLSGEGLTTGARMQTTLPATVSRLVPSDELIGGGYELPFLVELKADAPIGLYPLRVTTNDGLSNVVLFSVGDLPEYQENEAEYPKQLNDTPEKAEPLKIPGVMTGTLTQADVDLYAIEAAKGASVVVEVEARRTGSAIDPAIEVLDAKGGVIAKNDDAAGAGVDTTLEFQAPESGTYHVRVHDSKYSAQRDNFYRLKAGSFRYASSLYPLGWRRGEAVEVSLSGGNLEKPVMASPISVASAPVAWVHVPDSPSLPLPFVLSDSEEALEPASGEPAKLVEGTIMNGRIAKPGELDRYRLAVKPGQQWRLELAAASLGVSQLDAVLAVEGPDGKTLASRDDVGGSDPVVHLAVPDGVREVTVVVEDLLGRGGDAFGYRLVARQGGPDFTVSLNTPYVNVPAGGTAPVYVTVQRRGYQGPIKLTIPDLPKGFHATGGNVPSELDAQRFDEDENAGYRTASGAITLTADRDAEAGPFDLQVVATAETEHGTIERTATGPGIVTAVAGMRQRPFTAPWLGYSLPMARSGQPAVTLTPLQQQVRIAQGVEHKMGYRIERRSPDLSITRVRDEVSGAVGNLRILQGNSDKKEDDGYLLLSTNFATPTTTFDMLLTTTTRIDGQTVGVTAPAITFEIVKGYEVSLQRERLEIPAGGRVEISGEVSRDETFEGGLVRLKVDDLPENVSCETAEVPAAVTEFTIGCIAGNGVKPGEYEIRVASEAPDTGSKAKDTYKIPDVSAKLTVKGVTQAAR